jgi:hypothetical protein
VELLDSFSRIPQINYAAANGYAVAPGLRLVPLQATTRAAHTPCSSTMPPLLCPHSNLKAI